MYDARCKAVEKFIAKDPTRAQLTGVRLGDGFIEATDSYRLVRVDTGTVSPGDFPLVDGRMAYDLLSPVTVDGKAFVSALKTIPKGNLLPVLGHAAVIYQNERTVTLATTDLDSSRTTVAQIIEGSWPETDRLFPKDDADVLARVALNPSFLKEMGAAFEMFATANQPVVLSLRGAARPVEFEMVTGEARTMRAMLMSVRGEDNYEAPMVTALRDEIRGLRERLAELQSVDLPAQE